MGLKHWLWLGFCLLLCACSRVEQAKLKPLQPTDVILAFGDSLTFGTGAADGQGYPEQLARLTGLKVINAGVPGEETQDSMARIITELQKNQVQLVIVCLGGNDLIRKRPMPQIKANLRSIITYIQEAGIQVVLVAVPRPSLSLEVPSFYQELGQELNVPVEMVSLPAFLATPELKSDYIHLNAEGYQRLAQNLAEFLKARGAL